MLAHTSRRMALWMGCLALVLAAGCHAQSATPKTASTGDTNARVADKQANPLAKGTGATGGPAGRDALRPNKSP